jgi:DNA repair exonuclease SbcCD ATPase subunit
MNENNAVVKYEVLEIKAKESGLEDSKVGQLISSFGPFYNKAKEQAKGAKEIVVTDVSQIEIMSKARAKRLALKNVRVEVEKQRVQLKESAKREGQAIDGMANIIKALIIPIEDHLKNQEEFAERKAEEERIAREEALRVKVEKRKERLSAYVTDTNVYALDQLTDEGFESLIADAKKQKQQREEEERELEIQRKEQEEKRRKEEIRILEENRKLKKQADDARKKLQQEQEENRKREQAIEAERQREEEALRKRKEQELKEIQKAEEERQKKLQAPDKEKLSDLVVFLRSIEYPSVKSAKAVNALKNVSDNIQSVASKLEEDVKNL